MGRTARNAWLAIAATPLTFVLGTFVGEAIFTGLGYETGSTDAPLGPTLLAAVPAIAVIVSAPLLAWWLGRRAVAAGDPRGRAPMLLGLALAALVVVVNLAAALAS
ncbi:MAG: hypothetical protein ACKO8G_04215 [Actinomycetota bacterium]